MQGPNRQSRAQSRRGAGCLSAIQPVSYSVTYSVGWSDGSIEAAVICLAQESRVLSVHSKLDVTRETLLTLNRGPVPDENMQYRKTLLVSYGLGPFLFVCVLSFIHLCFYTVAIFLHVPESCFIFIPFSIFVSRLPSFALFPLPLLGQVQCRCWCLSIMKR